MERTTKKVVKKKPAKKLAKAAVKKLAKKPVRKTAKAVAKKSSRTASKVKKAVKKSAKKVKTTYLKSARNTVGSLAATVTTGASSAAEAGKGLLHKVVGVVSDFVTPSDTSSKDGDTK